MAAQNVDVTQTTETYLSSLSEPELAITIDDWKIEQITDAIEKPDGRYYKIKWVRYMWQREDSLQPLQQLIQHYWQPLDFTNTFNSKQQQQQQQQQQHQHNENTMSEQINVPINSVNVHCNQENETQIASTVCLASGDGDGGGSDSDDGVGNDGGSEDVEEFQIKPHTLHQNDLQSNNDRSTTPQEEEIIKNARTSSDVNLPHPNDVSSSVAYSSDASIIPNSLAPVEHQQSTDTPTMTQQSYSCSTNFDITHTSASNKAFQCQVCGKSFTRKTSLERHFRVHNGEKPFECSLCGKTFNQKSIMQRHMLIHSSKKPFQCELCQKSFVEKIALRRHYETHSNDKSHKCEHCGKTFGLKEYLSKHLFLHTGIKPYKCKECDSSFADPAACKRHATTHENRPKSVCEICSKTFKNERTMKQHRIKCKVSSLPCC